MSKPGEPKGARTDPWSGDVTLGVKAWVGEPTQVAAPPDPVQEGPDADREAVARKILLDQLTGQARSRQELAATLAKRNVPDALARELLDRFEQVGLVDDAAFARSWVESRQRSRGLAPRALAQELRRKGIDDAQVQEALEQVSDDDQEEAARALVRRKITTVRSVDRTTATRRLVGMLARKGYSSGLSFRVVKEELGADLDAGELGDL